jgi:predicted alpha/beta-fold hydrolase
MNLDGFRPHPLLPGAHLQTVVPALWPAPPLARPVEARIVAVAPGNSIRVDLSRPPGTPRGTLLLVHGMGGSSASRYVVRTATEALARGWAIARINMRNCGGTESLATTLYNACQNADLGAALADLEAAGLPRPFAAVGFSLGGNTLLSHAAAEGAGCRATAIAAVNPPIDLDASCRALERPGNRIYQVHYTRLLCRQIRRVRRVRPLAGPPAAPLRIGSVRRFDALFTAPDAGYPNPEEYYAAGSSAPRLGSIRIPTLVLSAANDPFVPAEMFQPHLGVGAGRLRFLIEPQGGHVGFWQRGRPLFWAARVVLDFLEAAS